MKQVKNNIRRVCIFLCILFALLAAYGGYSITVNGNRWFSSGANTFVRSKKKDVIAGHILDRNGQVLAYNQQSQTAEGTKTTRLYHTDPLVRRAMVHVVGDSQGNVNNGVESFMASSLYGFQMSLVERFSCFFRGVQRTGDDVHLTLDSRLSAYASGLFPKGKAGALVVMNYKTGEMLAEISLPQYDPQNVTAQAKNDPQKPFYNRAVQGLYAPGSTFKIVTASSALENFTDAATRAWQCTGQLQVGDRFVTDAGTDMASGKIVSHGQLNLLRAFQVSCNNTFAQIALENAIAAYQGAVLMVSHDFYTIVNCADYILYVEDKSIRRMRIRTFRKKIYANHFSKDYLELELKKKDLETRIAVCLKDGDIPTAKSLTDELAEIIDQMNRVK